MTWKERLIGLPLALIGAALLLATAAGMALTRTSWGREQVRSYVLEKLNGAIRGHVEIDAVLEGDLLRMVRMAGVRIYEPDGDEFAFLDTLTVHYRWTGLLIGNINLARVTMISPKVHLRTSPEGWNFEEVFASPPRDEQDTTGVSEGDGGRRVVLEDVVIRSGDITLHTPWDLRGTDPDSSRWFLEETDGGWERVFRFERFNATLARAWVPIGSDQNFLFQVSQLSCGASIIGDAIEIEQLRADVEVHHDTVSFLVWEGHLPDSQVNGEGWVTLEGRPEYDLTLRASPVTTRDVVWLIPQLPLGVANLDLRFQNLRSGITLEAQNARWDSPDAKASGRFAMELHDRPDGLRFDQVDLDVDYVNTAMISWLTGWDSPVAAALAGHVAVDGPLSELELDADVLVSPEDSSLPTHVTAVGVVNAGRGELGAADLELGLDTVRLDLVRAFLPSLAVRGSVAGRARLDGRLAQGLFVEFDVEQQDGNLVPTHLGGGGRITGDSTRPLQLDLSLTSNSFSLTTLSKYYPAIPLRGDYSPARFEAVGALDDLELAASLIGQDDSLRVSGNLRLTADPPRYSGRVQGWRVTPPEFRRGMPASDLDFLVEFRAQGGNLDELEASGRAQVFASFVGGVGFDSAAATLRIADRRLLVDTSVVVGEFGELHASGALSLATDVNDSLRFDLRADSIGALNPWLNPTLEALAAPTLVADGPGSASAAQAQRLEGAARVEGWIVREGADFAFRGDVSGERLDYGAFAADTFSLKGLEIGGRGGRLHAQGVLSATGVGLGAFRFDELSLSGEQADTLAVAEFDLAKEGAVISGRVRVAHGPAGRRVGLESLTLSLGSSTWSLETGSEVMVASSGAVAVSDSRLAGTAGWVAAAGSIPASGPTSFQADADGVDLGEVTLLWPDSVDLRGILEAHARLDGSAESPTLAGEFELVDGRLVGVDFSSLRGSVDFRGGSASLDVSMWRGATRLFRLHGLFPVDLSLPGLGLSVPERPIEMTLEGDSIPLTLATLITDQISELGGVAQGAIDIRGTPRGLDLEGPVTFANGRFRIDRTGILYEGLHGNGEFEGSALMLGEVTLRSSAGGQGIVTGTIAFTKLTDPEFDMTVEARELPVYDQLDAFAVVSGTMDLDGSLALPIVNGDLSIVSGILFVEEVGRQQEIVNLIETDFTAVDTAFRFVEEPRVRPLLDRLTLDLELAVERDTWLRSSEMNVEIAGNLLVTMRPDADSIGIVGTLQAVRGDYRLFNKRFAVDGGTIDFVGEGINPNLSIVALYTAQTQKRPIEIQLLIGGTLNNMELELASDHQPPIPQSDLFSYLLFGRPSYELTRTGQESSVINDVTSGVPQAFLGYALSSLLVGEAGIAYVDVSRVTPSGAEGEYRSGVGPALAATQVEVGWYLAPTVFIKVAQHLVGAVRPTVLLDWKLDERFTLRGVTEPRFGREGVLYYGGPGTDLEQSIGIFLFYGWGY